MCVREEGNGTPHKPNRLTAMNIPSHATQVVAPRSARTHTHSDTHASLHVYCTSDASHHVLHTLHRRGVHNLYLRGVLRRDPVVFPLVVHELHLSLVGELHHCSYGQLELPSARVVQPHVVSLWGRGRGERRGGLCWLCLSSSQYDAHVLCADCAGLATALELAPVRMHSRSERSIALRYIQGAGLAGLLCGRARTELPQTGPVLRAAYLSQNNHSPLAELLSLASDENGRCAGGRKWEGLRRASLSFSGVQAESVTNWTSSSDCFSEVQSLGSFSQYSWSRLVCSNLLQVALPHPITRMRMRTYNCGATPF